MLAACQAARAGGVARRHGVGRLEMVPGNDVETCGANSDCTILGGVDTIFYYK